MAADKGDAEMIKVLLNEKADVEKGLPAVDVTPLHLASRRADALDAVMALLDHKADVHVVNTPQQDTPLHYAIASENPDIVRALVAAKAVVNVINAQRETPLDVAMEHEYASVIQALREFKAIEHKSFVAAEARVEGGVHGAGVKDSQESVSARLASMAHEKSYGMEALGKERRRIETEMATLRAAFVRFGCL